MGQLGPNNGATFASDSLLGVVDITSPSNAALSDDQYASAALLLGQVSRYLKVTNFGFTIPLDATVTGVLVEVERSSTVGLAVVDTSVKLVKGGSITGNDKASASTWPTSDAYASYGSVSDLWGATLTPADINSSDFGVVISGTASLAATMRVDHVRITIGYTGSNKPTGATRYVRVGDGESRNENAY